MTITEAFDRMAGTTLAKRIPRTTGRHARDEPRIGMKPVSEWIKLPEYRGYAVHAKTERLPQVRSAA